MAGPVDEVKVEVRGDASGGVRALSETAAALNGAAERFRELELATKRAAEDAKRNLAETAKIEEQKAKLAADSAARRVAEEKRAQQVLGALIAKGDKLKELKIQLQREVDAYKEAASKIEGNERQKQEAIRAIRERYVARKAEITNPASPAPSGAGGAVGGSAGVEQVISAATNMRGALKSAAEPIEGIRSMLGALGVAGNSTVNVLGAVAQGIANVGGKAGIAGAALVAAGYGIYKLVEHVQEVEKLDKAIAAASASMGISRQEVDAAYNAWTRFDDNLDKRTVVKLVAAGHQAGLTAEEIRLLGEKAQQAADIAGTDFAQGFHEALGGIEKEARNAGAELHKLVLDMERAAKGIKADPQVARADTLADEKQKQRDDAKAEADRLQKEAQAFKDARGDGMNYVDFLSLLTKKEEAAADAAAKLAKQEAELAQARADQKQAANIWGDKLEKEALQGQAEDAIEIVNNKNKRLESATDKQAQILADQLETERRHRANLFAVMLAGDEQARALDLRRQNGGDERLTAIEQQRQKELDVLRRWNEARKAQGLDGEAWETERSRRETAINDKASEERAQYLAKQDEERRREFEQQQRQTEAEARKIRMAAEREFEKTKTLAEAGMNAGFTFLRGMKDAAESKDGKAMTKAFVGAVGDILALAVPGWGSLAGGFFKGVASLFHDGGEIGPGGERLPTAHDGRYITGNSGRGTAVVEALAGESINDLATTNALGGSAGHAAFQRQVRQGGGAGGGVTIGAVNVRVDGGRTDDLASLERDITRLMRRALQNAATPEMRRLAIAAGVR